MNKVSRGGEVPAFPIPDKKRTEYKELLAVLRNYAPRAAPSVRFSYESSRF